MLEGMECGCVWACAIIVCSFQASTSDNGQKKEVLKEGSIRRVGRREGSRLMEVGEGWD